LYKMVHLGDQQVNAKGVTSEEAFGCLQGRVQQTVGTDVYYNIIITHTRYLTHTRSLSHALSHSLTRTHTYPYTHSPIHVHTQSHTHVQHSLQTALNIVIWLVPVYRTVCLIVSLCV
jgi:hypothetical protein